MMMMMGINIDISTKFTFSLQTHIQIWIYEIWKYEIPLLKYEPRYKYKNQVSVFYQRKKKTVKDAEKVMF